MKPNQKAMKSTVMLTGAKHTCYRSTRPKDCVHAMLLNAISASVPSR